ncbi:adenomatous polyposis coli protein-like isoform X3 [Penaeus japonicus]|uniref:adenomatous polyposis coli protein-like isoform X3 n=1 Tax=Penaeus japonicus TaxID=27405 RepID=UPI001C711265|nr:adenomatous polyposis coli protein-like isoform X3 [Penaeus japonicus]
MLSVQAMIHRQEAATPLRKLDKASNRPDSNGSAKGRNKRKSSKKKRDAAAGGDDAIGDIFGEVRPPPGKGETEGRAVVAREWLLLRNTEAEPQGRLPAALAGDADAGRRRPDPNLSHVPVRKKDSRAAKSKKDANGNVRILKDSKSCGEDAAATALGDAAVRASGGVGGEAREDATRATQGRETSLSAEGAGRLHSQQEPVEGPPVKEVVIIDRRQPPDGARKSRHGTTDPLADKKERRGGVGKNSSVKRHSSGRSTGSEGSTLRRLRGRTTQRSSAATQTPPGSHTELHKCAPTPDNRRGSYRSHDGSGAHGADHKLHEEPPRRDISVGIPGASLLLKLVMPRDKRLSRHSGGSPSRDMPPSASPATARTPASPPLPWFWPPLRHVEAANPAHPLPPLTQSSRRGVALGGGEAEAAGGWSPVMERVVPFPPRAAPPVPRQIQGDQLSVSSMNSSLAGHTYEQVNFIIEPPISEGRENEYELDNLGTHGETFPSSIQETNSFREKTPEFLRPIPPSWQDSGQGSRRRPSTGQCWQDPSDTAVRQPADIPGHDSVQASGRRRPSSKRKRKKSRSAATTTDDSLVSNSDFQQDLHLMKEGSVERLGRRGSWEEVRRVPPVLTHNRRSSSSTIPEECRPSVTVASDKSSVVRGTHTLTIDKPLTVVVSEDNLQMTSSVSVSLPIYHNASLCEDDSDPCEAPREPTDPTATKDVKIIHRLLNIANQEQAKVTHSSPGQRHNVRRRGLYVPLDPETDTEIRSESDTFLSSQEASELRLSDQGSLSSSCIRYNVTPQPSDSCVDLESSSLSCLELDSSLEPFVPPGLEREDSEHSFVVLGGSPLSLGGRGGTPQSLGGREGTPQSVGGRGGTPQSLGGREGTPQSLGGREGTPQSVGGRGGTPQSLGGRGDSPLSCAEGLKPPSLYAKRLGTSEPYLNRRGSLKTYVDLKAMPKQETGQGKDEKPQSDMSLEEKVESLEASQGRRSWDRGDQLLCPVHGTAIPYQVGTAAALQRRRFRRASLPAQVNLEPRPSLLQRIKRSLKRTKHPDVLLDEYPFGMNLERRLSETLPPPVLECPQLAPGVACSCPDPVEDFRRFRPRIGSLASAVSSDEEDKTQRPPTPQDGCERWRLEGEVCRLQEALGQRLGTPAMMVRRRDHRLHTINTIEKTIQRLQQDAVRNHNNQNQNHLQDQQRGSSPVEHPSDIMDAVNANQAPDEDATTEDISEIRELDSLQSDTLTLHSADGASQGKGRTAAAGQQDADKAECAREKLFQPHQIPAGKMPPAIEAVLRGTWPFEKALWHSSPASMGMPFKNNNQEVPGIMATSSVTNRRAQSTQQLLTNKVEMVYGLLSMFSSSDRDDMSRTLLAMSSSPDSCVAMRQSGCLPLLIQLLHGCDGDVPPTRETRLRAAQALHNIVHSHPDDKRGRREARVLRLLEQIRDYSDYLYERLERTSAGRGPLLEDDMDRHPCPAMAALMKLSFDEDHRHAMCSLGGLHAIAELIRRDHDGHGSTTSDQYCITLRRYAGMALTNLTFGDGTNKALLCSFRSFLRALVSQLHSPSEDLRQVTASVLRNLSWRADGGSKASLRDVGAVSILMQAALSARKESTLKVILSAVWNLSAHCSINKAEICAVDGALAFICSTLTYKSQSKTLAIVENGGGILRNISSHIAVREDLRQVLREHNTLSILLGQLRSPSLTVVSNACGTLWNLSARCSQDQRTLWELGAVPMLRSLINSKHKMISMGSSAALKNLLQARPEGMPLTDPRHGMGLPSLQARKQKALEQELDPSLSETCDNIETSPRASPTHPQGSDPHFYGQPGDGPQYYPGARPMFHSLGAQYNNVLRSESRDSISSTHSDNSHDRMRQLLMRHQAGREPLVENGARPLDGRPLDLSLRSMAPPSHGLPDIARMSQDELQRHLDSQEFNGSADEIFASRVRNMKDIYSHQPGDSGQFPDSNTGSSGSIPRNGAFRGQGPQPPYSPTATRRRSSSTSDEERTASGRNFANGQQPHNEAHYNIYSKYVNFSRNLAEVNIENESQKEPLNYSLKYNARIASKTSTNESIANMSKTAERPEPQIDNYVGERRETRKTETLKEADRDQEDFTGYTETDLDQPTNFSLRYSEERDSDEAALYRRPPKAPQETPSQFFEPSVHDDSVKTYCTEGTPYETPYNFSTATSMTDLREPAIKEEIEREKSVSPGEEKKEKELKVDDLENIEDSDDARDTLEPLPSQSGLPVKSGLSSGMMTPDKPITYCVEGTPVCLSRFSSVSSLTSGEINANNDRDGLMGDLSEDGEQKPEVVSQEKKGRLQEPRREAEQADAARDGSHTPSSQQLDRPEGKSVHYEETPLMFSRATSVSSLSSFEVQSIHDDRSSVVSDFSRFTSGAISPSDLPDSPSQTVPPSPKRSRPPSQPFKPPPAHTEPRTSTGVFSEAPKAWVEEGTPVEFSRATSLSSLTIDDELPLTVDVVPRDRLRGDGKDSSENTASEGSRAASRGSQRGHQIPCSNIPRFHTQKHEQLESEGRDEDEPKDKKDDDADEARSREHSQTRSSTHSDSESENILAECISSGMPTSTQRSSKQYSGRGPSRIGRPAAVAAPRSSIPVAKAANLPTQIPSAPTHTHAQQGIGGGVWGGDTLRTYCTEDTPANISHAASISDLSQLSIPGEESGKDLHGPSLRPSLNDSGDNSSDNDNLLEQCIQSAMPKARPGAKVKDVKIGVKRHGTGHLCSHGVPPPAAPVLPSPRRSPHHRPVPVARVTPAVKVAGTRVSPHPPSGVEDVSKDQVRMWATEGTPATFSRADSLSSLSCEDEMNRASRDPSPRTPQSPRARTPQSPQPQAQTTRPRTPQSPRMRRSRQQHMQQRGQEMVEEDEEVPKQFAVEGTPGVISRHSSLSSLEGDSPVIQPQNAPQATGVHKYGVEDTPVCFSRNSSLSSLSVDSYGEETTPTEQALLQQCISQGMPKSKSDLEGRRKRRGGSRIPAPSSRSPARLVPGVPMQRLTLCREQPSSPSKNVETTAAAVEEVETDAVMYTPDAESSKLRTDSEQSEKNERAYRHVEEEELEDEEEEEESHTDHTEIESVKTTTTAEICDIKSEVTSEGSAATVVTQPLRKEEKSPVELEEQRISEESVEGLGSSPEEKQSWEDQRRSGDKSSPSEGRGSDTSVTASMSESGLIAVEAMKVARAVAGEAKLMSSDETPSHMSHSIASAASDACLDNIKPPSAMGSLASMSNSLTSSAEERLPRTGNRRLECRHTRRLPEMVRRALGDQDYGSNENMASMASSCHSNLDNIPPPSMLDDDMENSMISVASITSEVAEQRESPPSPPVDHTAQVAAPARQLAAIFRQEAMNAASTLTLTGGDEASTYQEITDITEHEDTVGPASDTEMAADDLPSDIPDLPQDGFSSASQSSPLRVGTPRSRRQQAKDRFRTFTRGDGEMSDATPSQDTDPTLVEVLPSSPSVTRTPKQRRQDDSERYRTRTISTDSTLTNTPSDMGSIEVEKEKVSPRRSPKERRQQDPSRFQTHTISESPASPEAAQEAAGLKIEDLEAPSSPPKLQGKQSFRQRRQEDRERYQTRTIDVPLSDITPDAEAQAVADEDKEGDGTLVDFQDSNEMLDLTAEQLEALQQDANIVICTLNETREAMTSESSDLLSEENILDIETLSLISNEDELDLKNFLRDADEDPPDKGEEEGEEEEEEEEEEVQQILRRPRIVKPGEEVARPIEEDDGAGKGIRGRRKPLYSSARKYSATPAKAAATSASPARIIPVRSSPARPSSASPVKPSSPKLPRATRASALRQTSNIQRGGSSGEESPTGRATGSSAGSSAGSSPRLGPAGRGTITRPARSKSLARPGPDPPRPLRRQNTFTKDDSDTPLSPERTVQVESKKTAAPVRGISKPRIRRDTVQPSPSVRTAIPKSGSQDLSPTKGRPPQTKSTSLTRDARPPTSSDMAEWRPESKKTVKKEVTSRIANLWKKVERAQSKPKEEKKDARVWISRPKSAAKETPPRPLVRSSTYEKLPGVESSSASSDAGKSRTRLGLKLAKLRGRDTRSSPPSEATTPVDSRPHCLVSPTRSRMTEVHVRQSETVQLRQRPATHPPAVGQGEEDSEARAKRLSRLGSFIVVEEDGRVRSPPQSAIVPPFNYQPPVAPRVRSAVATRIPQPSKSLLSNAPCARDDNGNAADPSVVTGAWRP